MTPTTLKDQPEFCVQSFAAAIAEAIQDAVLPDEWAEMRRRNATPEYRGGSFCASHNFVDSNHYALAAFQSLYGREADLGNDFDIEHLTQALDAACKNFLTAAEQ